jgi:hypothetical protein
MPDPKTPMQRQREERRALGWRDANIWLTPEGQQRVARLSEPGESLSALLERALAALDILQRQKGTRAETRDVPSEVPSEATRQEDLQSIIASEVTRYLSSERFHEQVFFPLLKQAIASYLPSETTRQRSRELPRETPSRQSRDVPSDLTSKAAMLQRLRTLQAEGLSLQAMADRLNAEGVPTLTGHGKWYRGTIANLFKGK